MERLLVSHKVTEFLDSLGSLRLCGCFVMLLKLNNPSVRAANQLTGIRDIKQPVALVGDGDTELLNSSGSP